MIRKILVLLAFPLPLFAGTVAIDQTSGTGSISFVSPSETPTGGSGGSSTLETLVGVRITSPTATIAFDKDQFTGVATGSTATIAVNTSSITALGPNIDLSGSEVTGTLAAARFPALTGDVTTSAGSLATSLAATLSGTKTFLSSITVSGAGLRVENSISASSITVSSNTYLAAGASFYANAPPQFSNGLILSNLNAGECVQTTAGGRLTTTGSACGTGTGGGSGYAVEPATVTFNLAKGFTSSTGTITGRAGLAVTYGVTASSAALSIADTDNADVLSVTQNDVTNNKNGIVVTSTGTGNAIKIVSNGTSGTNAATSGGFVIDCTGSGGTTQGFCTQFYSNAGAQSAISPLIYVRADNTAFNYPLMMLVQDGTSGGAANLRMDGPAPQIEMVESDQSTPAGKFELGVNGDLFYVSGRNAADNSFEDLFKVSRKPFGPYMALYSTGAFRFYDSDSSNYSAWMGSETITSNVLLRMPTSIGTSGQALHSDGQGGTYWDTDATGSGGGDNLGSHIATMTVTAMYSIVTSSINISSNTIMAGTTFYRNASPTFTNSPILSDLSASQFVMTDANKKLTTPSNFTPTGTWDFGGASGLEIPNGTGPTVDAVGEVAFDTTDNVIVAYDGTAARVYADAVMCETKVIGSSGTWDSQSIPIYQVHPNGAITLISVHAAVMGGTSLTYNIEERAQASLGSAGTDIYSSDQVADTNGEDETVFSNAGIAANAHLVFTTGASAASGNVEYISLRLCWRRDVE